MRVWAPDRDELAHTLAEASSALDEHLDDEERHLLPLVPGNVSVPEWDALNERARTGNPPRSLKQALVLMGFALEDATPQERTAFMGKVPWPGRILWKLLGQRQYRNWRADLSGSAR